jgi:hypothetical protein
MTGPRLNDTAGLLLATGMRQSRWLLQRPGDARWMISEAVNYLKCSCRDGNEIDRMKRHLAGSVRARYGNPLLVWCLLNVILPIVVKLVIEWWSNRKER